MKFKAKFLIADCGAEHSYDVFDSGNSVECPETLLVTMEFDKNKVIGSVKVNRNGDVFEGEFNLIDRKPVSKNTIQHLSPAVAAEIIESEMINGCNQRLIKKCRIDSVALIMCSNCDSRIGKLKDIEIEE